MTITHEERRAYEIDRLKSDLEVLQLPSVADIAGPILRGLMALHDFGNYSFDAGRMAFELVEHDRFRDEAEQIVRFVEEVASAVEHGVASLTPHPDRSMHPANARAMVLAIFDIDELRSALRSKAHEAMMYPDD